MARDNSVLRKPGKILILTTLPVLIVLIFFAYSYFSRFISSEEDARKCAIASLNGFGIEHNSIMVNFVGKKYSELMESIHLNEMSGGEYFFTATLKSIYGPVRHDLVIPSHGACPVFFSEYNVTIDNADDEIYKEIVNDTKAWEAMKAVPAQ